MTARSISEVELQIMWNRLLSVVEEQGQTLVRTAFSTSAREAGDISAGVFDLKGRMLAQAVTGTPGHINTMALSVGHFLDVFRSGPGRTATCSSPTIRGKGTGHLYDLVVVSPTFLDGKMVAIFACTSHLVDMGGVGQTPEGRQIWHEGLFIPLMKLARAGVMNEDLLGIIRANVREPVQVIGDVYALTACNDIGSRRLVEMMREFGLDEVETLGAMIIARSRAAMTEAIGKLPKGTWESAMRIDGYEQPIDLVARVTIGEDTIEVDYTGTSGMSSYAINCPLCYTEAYTTFGVNCVVAPYVPNNAGTLAAVKVKAPPGCIVNATYPAAVYARASMGHMLPDVVYGALDQALPGRVPAEGTSNLWTLKFVAGHGLTRRRREPGFVLHGDELPFRRRRRAAAAGRAVRHALPQRRAQRAGRGDGGHHAAGGLAQGTAAGFWRRRAAARRPRADHGGRQPGECAVRPVRRVRAGEVPGPRAGRRRQRGARQRDAEIRPGAEAERLQVIPAGDRVVIEMPGGGGMGSAAERDPGAVKRDVRLGYLSAAAARRDYGAD